jgi:hypothetical protein
MASLDTRAAPPALDNTPAGTGSGADPSLTTFSAHLPYNKHDAGFVYRQTWKGKIWDTLDLPPFERRMLAKVDAVLLTLMALGYFLKNLDQHNITAAVSRGVELRGRGVVHEADEIVLLGHAARPKHVRQRARHGNDVLDCGVCHWADSDQSAPHACVAALGHPDCK